MKIGDVARAALPRSEYGEQLALALEELQQQVNAITDFIATTGEPVTLETAAEDGGGEVVKLTPMMDMPVPA